MQRSVWRSAAMVVAGALLLSACSTVAPATQAPTQAVNSKDFWIGFTSVGLSSAPFLSAIAKLNEQGYDIKTPILAQSELVTEGVAQGQFAFGSGANNAVLAAIEQGANLKVVVDRVANEWTLYARTATVTACADLAGQRLALHSAGAVSTAMVHNYLETNCPGTAPEEVFIEGSPNRVAALLADQIDASPLELGDSITIDNEAGETFSLLSSFSADLPDLKTTSIYVNGDWAAQNPESVTAVVRAVIEEFRLVSADAAYLKAVAQAQVPDAINENTIDQAVAKYIELGMFPVDGGVTAENLQYSAEFFGPDGAGAVDRVVPLEEWADLSYLDAVLGELGSQ